jgi:hypothetical protein
VRKLQIDLGGSRVRDWDVTWLGANHRKAGGMGTGFPSISTVAEVCAASVVIFI